MFEFTFGDVGSGKSLRQAKKTLALLDRSWYLERKKHLPKREVWCNFHLNDGIMEKYKDRFRVWHLPQEMIFEDYPENKILRKNFDCVWDELAVELPSDKWKDTDPAIRYFFAQHRKRGIEIFGNTQDYMMLDINVRRMATSVYQTHKIIGNRDPSATLPKINLFWGLVLAWRLDKSAIRDDPQNKKHADLFPEFIWITKTLCQSYDTSEDVQKSEKNRMLHIDFWCDKCNKIVKVEHLKT